MEWLRMDEGWREEFILEMVDSEANIQADINSGSQIS